MKTRQLSVRMVWWLVLLFSLGFWTGLIVAAKTLADVPWRLASQVNRQVNAARHGPDDNCVDFSNRKLAALLAAGADPRDVRTEVVRVRVGAVRRFHQVVVARVNGQDVVLDNQTPAIWPLDTYLRANRPFSRK